MHAPPQSTNRRRQRVIRTAFAGLSLLALFHYLSLQRAVHSCHSGDPPRQQKQHVAAAGESGGSQSSSRHQHAAGVDDGQIIEAGQRGGSQAAAWGDEAGEPRQPRRIPRILHQSWKDSNVPERFHEWQASWRKLHPNWEFRLWTDADNRQLLADHYPWFLKTYDAFPKPIMRADAIRPFYMHRHGGVYADLDMEAVRNVEPLLGGTRPVLAFLGETWWLRHNIPNAWMASPPGHPFWQFCWAHTMLEFKPNITEADYFNEGIERVTGPVALMECLEAYVAATGRNVTVLPPGQIFAYDWHKVTYCRTDECIQRVQVCGANEPTFDPAACKAHYPDAYAITYWAHTWGENATTTAEAAAAAGASDAVAAASAAAQGAGNRRLRAALEHVTDPG